MSTDTMAPPGVHDDDNEPKRRKTYPQVWSAYHTAQNYEKEYFLLLMSEVVDTLTVPEHRAGRPRHSLTDIIKSMLLKVYGHKSTRRSMADLREAHVYGYIEAVPHYNTVIEYFSDPELTPMLHELIRCTSLPLSHVETGLAADSSGFSTSGFLRWHAEKHGKKEDKPKTKQEKKAEAERKMREWLKLHMLVGEKTQIVVSATVEGWASSDYRQFIPLLARVPSQFRMREIYADGAYLGRTNMDAAELMGATPYIPYDSRVVPPDPSDDSIWARMYWMFHHREGEWKAIYHRRSKVETAFSSIKRLFGGSIRSKNHVAQVNEVLCKVVCHNLVVLIHEMHELGVYPEFVNSSRFLGAVPEEALPEFFGRRYDHAADRTHRGFGWPDTTLPDVKRPADILDWPHHDPTADHLEGLHSGW